jgi:catechol 2,3-dioxygenase-like lactoylglutathione lyase family enzyme
MLTIGAIVLGVEDMNRAAAFWCRALDYAPDDGDVNDDWTELVPVSGDGPVLALDLSDSPVQEHPRLHLDLHVRDELEQASEIGRLLSLGAERVDWDLYPEDPDFVVLADPEGNRFCVVDTAHG